MKPYPIENNRHSNLTPNFQTSITQLPGQNNLIHRLKKPRTQRTMNTNGFFDDYRPNFIFMHNLCVSAPLRDLQKIRYIFVLEYLIQHKQAQLRPEEFAPVKSIKNSLARPLEMQQQRPS